MVVLQYVGHGCLRKRYLLKNEIIEIYDVSYLEFCVDSKYDFKKIFVSQIFEIFELFFHFYTETMN